MRIGSKIESFVTRVDNILQRPLTGPLETITRHGKGNIAGAATLVGYAAEYPVLKLGSKILSKLGYKDKAARLSDRIIENKELVEWTYNSYGIPNTLNTIKGFKNRLNKLV
ncbi:MAG: hypothetical protein A2Y25_05950 [Candidatus Melainabacteria bacterium GWF2_37_15]|nr:MAG: hypothetical protein A2Y25_05950 [Candidatus Melainabacteria bacterium GWF2_37_15]